MAMAMDYGLGLGSDASTKQVKMSFKMSSQHFDVVRVRVGVRVTARCGGSTVLLLFCSFCCCCCCCCCFVCVWSALYLCNIQHTTKHATKAENVKCSDTEGEMAVGPGQSRGLWGRGRRSGGDIVLSLAMLSTSLLSSIDCCSNAAEEKIFGNETVAVNVGMGSTILGGHEPPTTQN